MITDGSFTENEHQRIRDVPKRYALPAAGRDQEDVIILHDSPAKRYLEGNPSDGYPLGLPAGVAGGLSGK
jgi:hypothetical protein